MWSWHRCKVLQPAQVPELAVLIPLLLSLESVKLEELIWGLYKKGCKSKNG
jgi:hypothetical protein